MSTISIVLAAIALAFLMFVGLVLMVGAAYLLTRKGGRRIRFDIGIDPYEVELMKETIAESRQKKRRDGLLNELAEAAQQVVAPKKVLP